MISIPPKGDSAKKLGAYFAPLKVEAQASPNMTVKVAEGGFYTADNEYKEFYGGTTATIAAPTSNAKWVLVTLTSAGQLYLVNGTAGANPDLPDVSAYADKLPLAAIFVGDTTTALTNDMIYDLRPMWQIQPDSVEQSQLDLKADITYVDNRVATKADIKGTSSLYFNLNNQDTIRSYAGLWLERGAGDVGIRFNEAATVAGSPLGSPSVTAQWEFTNDGSTWNPIGVGTGSFYTKVDLDGGALNTLYYQRGELDGLAGSPTVGTGALDSRYYVQQVADALFAPTSHHHLKADIIDLSTQVETVNGISPNGAGALTLNFNDLNDVQSTTPTTKWVPVHNGTKFQARLMVTDDLADVDTTTTPPTTYTGALGSTGSTLIWNGSVFYSKLLEMHDISNFTGSEFVLATNLGGSPTGSPIGTAQDIYGIKTFKDGVVVEQSLTVTGNNTSIETNQLYVTDSFVDINYGETGHGVSAGTAGIRIDRGTGVGSPVVIGSPEISNVKPDAIIQWDETAEQWEFGVVGSAAPVLTAAHTHLASQVTDFSSAIVTELDSNNLNAIADVFYHDGSPALGNRQHLLYNGTQNYWENKDFATSITTELNTNNLSEMADVTYHGSPTLAPGQVLVYESGDGWSNHDATKSIIVDFTESDYIHITGDETKNGSLTLNGNLTIGEFMGSPVTETTVTINSINVRIKDHTPVLNYGETGAGVDDGSGNSGLEIDRGTAPQNALILWDEPTKRWRGSHGTGLTVGSPEQETLTVTNFSYEGHEHVLSDIPSISASVAEVNYLVGVTSAIQTQLNDKISRSGEGSPADTSVMDNGISLTFASGGEVLGLPATPTVDDAATSKLYVDTGLADKISRSGEGSPANTSIMDSGISLVFSGGGEVTGLPASPSATAAASKEYVDTEAATVQAALHAHAIDTGSPTVFHMTADQNTFLDAISTGSPALAGAEINTLSGIDTGTTVQVQLDDKISRSGEGSPNNTSVMDSGISLVFSGNGEVIGLPATPVQATAATSVEYVDTQDAALQAALHAHAIDTGSPTVFHMTSEQNTFLDGLNITGSPETLTAAHVNFLSNVTSNVQDQLNLKANFVGGSPNVVGNLLMVASDGDMEDSTVAVNDSGTTTADIWTANKIDTTKADKVTFGSPVGTGNFAGLDANGNLTDSTSKAADFALAVHTHVAADVTDFGTAADARIAAAVFDDLSDITFAALADGDYLQYDSGTTDWVNIAPSAITEFVHSTGTESIAGVKTFSDNTIFGANVNVTGNLTVLGTTTFIDSTNLEVTDKNITLNKGYNGPTSGSTGSGLYIVRDEAGSPIGSPIGSPNSALGANLIWDDALLNFKAGIDGSETELARVGLTTAQPAYDIQTGQGGSPVTDLVYTLTGAEWNIPAPAANHAAIQIFVNGIKQVEGAGKAYTVTGYGTGTITITFNAGSEPATGTDIEFYGFGYIE